MLIEYAKDPISEHNTDLTLTREVIDIFIFQPVGEEELFEKRKRANPEIIKATKLKLKFSIIFDLKITLPMFN